MTVTGRLALCGLLAAGAGCAQAQDFADWTIPVGETVPVFEYAYVPAEDRTETIELVEELAIGGNGEDPRYAFYNPRGIAVDDAGRIYVADAADHEVKVFDPDGAHLHSLGRQGQGPAEFLGPSGVEIAGSIVVVIDRNRLSYWDFDGKYLGEIPFGNVGPTSSEGLDDGSVLVLYPTHDDQGRQISVIARWNSEGTEEARFEELPDPPGVWYPARNAEGRVGLSIAPAIPSFSATRAGRVYVTQADEYQVIAFERDGTQAWALRTSYLPPAVSRMEIDRAMESIRRRFPAATESEVDWPETEPALTKTWVDGHGHLYVFPYMPGLMGLEPQERPVDVYSAGGKRLFSGVINSQVWIWAARFHLHGDHLYDIRRRPDGDEEIVRYRLVEPLEQ